MDLVTACMITDGSQEPEDEDQLREAWQYLIDTGMAWKLQGSLGRQADRLIEAGFCNSRETK